MKSLKLAILAVILITGCSKPENRGTKGILLPWPSPTGEYTLQVVEVHTLKNIERATGEAAEVVMQPRLMNKKIVGDPASVRAIETSEGVLVPSDMVSSQVLTLYAHMEKLWELDRALGVDGWLPRPRRIGLNARIPIGPGGLMTNNAAYDFGSDGVIIMPYDPRGMDWDKQLPIAMNAGIIAHEYFHALFSSVMGEVIRPGQSPVSSQPLPTEGRISSRSALDKHNLLLMRAFNEGLADVWAWVYTGDLNFIGHSLAYYSKTRKLNPNNSKALKSTLQFTSDVNIRTEESALALSYEFGTALANSILRYSPYLLDDVSKSSSIGDLGARYSIAQHILSVLPKLKTKFLEHIANRTLIPTTALTDLLFEKKFSQKLSQHDCSEIQSLLSTQAAQSFLKNNCL